MNASVAGGRGSHYGAERLPTVIVLAAGRSERFRASGGQTHKLDATLNGISVLRYVLRAVEDSGLPAYVVRPAGSDGAAMVFPAFCTDGMGDSIASGVRAMTNSPGWLILPGDLPLIMPQTLRQVAQALQRCTIVVPRYRNRRGHPVGFHAECRPSLETLSGDQGAAQVVQAYRTRGQVMDLSVDDAGVVADIDTLDDLINISTSVSTTPLSEAAGRTGSICHGYD